MSQNTNDSVVSSSVSEKVTPNLDIKHTVSSDKLDQIISRLEHAIEKVENLSTIIEYNNNNLEESNSSPPLSKFWEKLQKFLKELKEKSLEMDNVHFEELTEIFIESICFQQDILIHSPFFQKPGNEEMKKLLSILQIQIKRIEKILLEPLSSLHVELVQKGMNTLMWMFDNFKCVLIVNNNLNMLTEIANKIILKGNKIYTEWTQIFMKIMKEIVEYVTKYHKNGLIWLAEGNNNIFDLILEIGNTYKKYFKKYSRIFQEEISFNQILENDKMNSIFEAIKNKELKNKKDNNKPKDIIDEEIKGPNNISINNDKVYDQFMELKNDSNINKTLSSSNNACFSVSCRNVSRNGSYIEDSSTFGIKTGIRKKLLSFGKVDHYEEKDNIVLYENFDGIIKNIKPDILDYDTFVRITNCLNCTFKISKRINRIIILNCQNCKVICDELLSNIEIVNSTEIIVQCEGLVNMANVEGCRDITFILLPKSRYIPIYCHHSTLIRVQTPKGDDKEDLRNEYDEYIFPEQFEFGINDNMKLEFNVTSI
jgi:hypothetical protein